MPFPLLRSAIAPSVCICLLTLVTACSSGGEDVVSTSAGDSIQTTASLDSPVVDSAVFQRRTLDKQAAVAADSAALDTVNGQFVDPLNGSDSNAGSLSMPFQTIAHAVDQLTAGDTLYLRTGVYNENGIDVEVNGTQDKQIIVRNYPGENVVINGSLPQFRTTGQGLWDIVDADTNTYSTDAGSFGSGIYNGTFLDLSGKRTNLVAYYDNSSNKARGMADLMSEEQNVSSGARYVGPGVYNDSGRLYIRLDAPAQSALHGQSSGLSGTLDPNQVSLDLYDENDVFTVTGSNVVFDGLSIRGARKGFDIKGQARDITLRNMTFDSLSYAVSLREGTNGVVVELSRFNGNFPSYVAWTDMKGSSDGQSMPASHWSMKVAGVSGSYVHNIEVRNNTFNDIFDGMSIGGDSIDFSNNTGFFIDDALQIGSNSSNVQVYDNHIEGAGPSHYGKGDSSEPGTIFVYNNIIDSRRDILWGRHDSSDILRSSYKGWHAQTPFPTHSSSSLNSGDPWKIYGNTVMFDSSLHSRGAGFGLWKQTNDTGMPHEVYNNIFVETGGGVFVSDLSTRQDGQQYDGNLYWRSTSSDQPIFEDITGLSGTVDFDSLAQFQSSNVFEKSKSVYSPGWESNGIQADPELDAQFRPKSGGPASQGAVTLPVALPGPRHGYRGAVAPN